MRRGPFHDWRNVVYLLYDLLLILAGLGLIPYYLLRGLKYGKSRRGIRDRLGLYAAGHLAPLDGRKVIWVHAVSVGETRAAVPLLEGLRRAHPDHAIVLSNVTETGHAIAAELDCVDLCLFFPFDISVVIRRVLGRIRPELIVLVETEIWPNFVRLAHRRGIPVALVNGRISDRSYPRYKRFRLLLRPILDCIELYAMQTELDAERIHDLGAGRDRIGVSGNLKFDMGSPVFETGETDLFRTLLGLAPEQVLLVAGSTHDGEEELLVQAYRSCLETNPGFRLMLVPRHPERTPEVAGMITQSGLQTRLRSQCEGLPLDAETILIGDTLGEMLKFYDLADIVFVGGSLVPVGGHNILEASLLQKPVLFGPHMNNFREISRLVLFARGGRQVNDLSDLVRVLNEMLAHPEQRERMGRAGKALLDRHAGATDRSLELLSVLLERRG
ncbi:3-deoxy-D-manno-octulosonic acid transferase [Geothermobacter hydrogeniphilus]|uniref:3-deoxy-D-manno-octulosonic acid transferase n=1 Tax=Geothermobacter hydrogeniphilus TaxID=1969733 RepID=A0A2K2HC82_9BACT|nr:3-deoxy-D-manno-octulosonic acid transferase [Geothermobacter hydrogeniphilus]